MILHYPLAMAFCSSTVRLTERDMVACEIFSWDLYGTYSLPELGSSLLTLVPLLGRVHPPDSPLLFYQQQRGPTLSQLLSAFFLCCEQSCQRCSTILSGGNLNYPIIYRLLSRKKYQIQYYDRVIKLLIIWIDYLLSNITLMLACKKGESPSP